MCQQILQFCSGSMKPLLLAGGLFSFLSSVAIGYMGFNTNALYNEIDPQVASDRALSFYLQLAAAVYLAAVTGFSLFAAHRDQKHSIRALATLTSLNFILAVAAILMVPSGSQLSEPFQATLKEAAARYNFSDQPAVQSRPMVGRERRATLNATPAAEEPSARVGEIEFVRANLENATRIWDNLQARGCCGINNGTLEWTTKIPKSCCATPANDSVTYFCNKIDDAHQQGCLALIGATSLHLMIVLALIALLNLYLAIISGISAYKTYSYSEASQNAYT